jgi:hypothetical protein
VVIYDDLVAETLIEPDPPPAERVEDAPPAAHNAMDCPVCHEWLAHVREVEDL